MPRPIIVPDEPYIVRKAIGVLDFLLGPSDEVFEWGSGGSTVWIAQRVKRVVTVDHDPKWHDAVIEKAKRAGVRSRITFHLITPLQIDPYADVITAYHQDWDAIIIDGKSETRGSCTVEAIERVKPGGFIMLDNSEASKASRELLDRTGWLTRTRVGDVYLGDELMGKTETGFWFKPLHT